jgi:hypothetical protein
MKRTHIQHSGQGEKDRQLMFSLVNAGRAIEQRLEEALARVGLSLAKFGALTHLMEAGEPLNQHHAAHGPARGGRLGPARRRSTGPPGGKSRSDAARGGAPSGRREGSGESAGRAGQDIEQHGPRCAAARAFGDQIADFFRRMIHI